MPDATTTRRSFIGHTALAAASLTVARVGADDGKATWHDVTEWGVEGRGFTDEKRERWFDRLPAEAKGRVTEAVWNLSRHSAGMAATFETDATTIVVRYKLMSGKLDMPHMPATGVSGVDLYAQDDTGTWRWAGVAKPTSQTMTATLLSGGAPGRRRYRLYLPLYNGVDALSVAVPDGATLTPIKPRDEKPIVFYGTSIMHGACASRPGMAIPAILGRRLDRPTVNLGFSGNGRMHAAVGDLLVRIDAAVYAIDCSPNMNATTITERTEPLVRQLRAKRPDTPIVLVEDRVNTNAWIHPARLAHHKANHKALRGAYDRLVAAGVKGLHYLPADDLLGDDHDGATDGSHPSDLGFVRYADAYEPVLRKALGDA